MISTIFSIITLTITGLFFRSIIELTNDDSPAISLLLKAYDVVVPLQLVWLLILFLVEKSSAGVFFAPMAGFLMGVYLFTPVKLLYLHLYPQQDKSPDFKVHSQTIDHGPLKFKFTKAGKEWWFCPVCDQDFPVRPRPKDEDTILTFKNDGITYTHYLPPEYTDMEFLQAYLLLQPMQQGNFLNRLDALLGHEPEIPDD